MKALDLMDLLDYPDNASNMEAFAWRNAASPREWEDVRFDYTHPPTLANARKSVEKLKLLGDLNAQALNTDWMLAARPYAIYKVCKTILDHPHYFVEVLFDDIFNMFADIIGSCVRDSPKTLVEHSRKWAAEFREDKISAAIKLAGFACGVIDKAKMQDLHL